MRKVNKAKQQAILDMQEDLHRQGKCFISFVKALNPVMGTLVTDHIRQQRAQRPRIAVFKHPKATLTASCFLSVADKPVYTNYEHVSSNRQLRHRKTS